MHQQLGARHDIERPTRRRTHRQASRQGRRGQPARGRADDCRRADRAQRQEAGNAGDHPAPPARCDGRRQTGRQGRPHPPVPLPQAVGAPHRRTRPQGAPDDLRCAAQFAPWGCAAVDAGRPPRPQYRGPAADDQRRRTQAGNGVALERYSEDVPGADVRRCHPEPARRSDRGRDGRGRQLRPHRRQSRTQHRPQPVDRTDADRRQEPRSPPGARTPRAPGQPPAANRLRPLRARRPSARGNRRIEKAGRRALRVEPEQGAR